MVRDAAAARRRCPRRRRPALLESRTADRAGIAAPGRSAEGVAPKSDVGLFLPYSPLHHLLLRRRRAAARHDVRQRRDEPIAYRRRRRAQRLREIADLFLVHDRDIETRVRRFRGARSSPARRPCCAARAATYRAPCGSRASSRSRCSACGAHAEEHVLPRRRTRRLARPAHRRSREPRDVRAYRRRSSGWSASSASPAGRRARPAPRLSVDALRARRRGGVGPIGRAASSRARRQRDGRARRSMVR